MSRSGIVNVRMVITEEKILSNISKVQRMIDPNSKKQIIQLEDDAFFKDLVESIKTYLNIQKRKISLRVCMMQLMDWLNLQLMNLKKILSKLKN